MFADACCIATKALVTNHHHHAKKHCSSILFPFSLLRLLLARRLMDLNLTPTLPADLERRIFEVASLAWPRSIARFLLVAWRVKTWVEPLLYRIIIVHDARAYLRDKSRNGTHPLAIESSVLLSIIQAKGPQFFKDAVRHLLLGSHNLDETDEAYVLSACSNVENLWLSAQSYATLPQIDMPFKRLHCRLNTLFEPQPIDITHQLFALVTHLEVFDLPARGDVDVWAAVTHLPRLTHLAFNDEVYLPVCSALLQTSTSLQVLVLMLDHRGQMDTERWKDWDVMDVRFVAMVCDEAVEDWIVGAHTGADYWSRAEEFIAKRKFSIKSQR
ncbi:hypothetical protein DFH06DRAFT_1468725 [Mycena polygramma]|nr:hypothetical protein DFH06DRAFT_1468725 [Mycena polygramma]